MKKIFTFCEYVIIFIILALFCFYINKGINIYGLYMDDLYNWSYFPETNIFTFAFKFYENATRYRPFYDMMQYIEYMIVGHSPIYFTYINLILNSLIALFIYYFSKKLNDNILISLLVSGMYVLSHFSYYQIGQTTGLVETMALFLSLFILYFSIKYIEKKDNKIFILLMVLYFLMAFTHERFLSLYGVIVFSIIFSSMINESKINFKDIFKKIVLLSIEVAIILFIRKLAIGKVVPAGTGGTYVEDTFSIKQVFVFCINQVQYILGMNVGPTHLCGINYFDLDDMTKKIVIIHMMLVVALIVFYIVFKIAKVVDKKEATKEKRLQNGFIYFIKNFYIDILFLEFIAFAIVFSSITIRVEMRFVYVSFTAFVLYLSYMVGYIINNTKKENITEGNVFFNNVVKVICVVFFISIVLLRIPVEKTYRDNYDNIYFFADQKRMNSLALNTVYKYDEDIIDKKKVYILYNMYGMSKFYGDYFFQIYQKDYKLRPITFISDFDEYSKIDMSNSIVLKETADMLGYEQINVID